MTYKQLKAEADKLGYSLIKTPDRVKLIPCKCGGNRRSRWHKGNQVQLQCMRCGYISAFGNGEVEARKNWNKEMSK